MEILNNSTKIVECAAKKRNYNFDLYFDLAVPFLTHNIRADKCKDLKSMIAILILH